MNKLELMINEEIVRLCEEWLGIDGITKDDYYNSMKGHEHWALFAHIYDKYFEQITNKNHVDDMVEKLISHTKNPKIINAIIFFGDFRKKELE